MVPTISWSKRFIHLIPEAISLDSNAAENILPQLSETLVAPQERTPKHLINAIYETMTWVNASEIASDFDPGDGDWETWGPSKRMPFKASGSIATYGEMLLRKRCEGSPETEILKAAEVVGSAPLYAFMNCRRGQLPEQFQEGDVLKAVYAGEGQADRRESVANLCAAFVEAGLAIVPWDDLEAHQSWCWTEKAADVERSLKPALSASGNGESPRMGARAPK
jgi:hypothetical protein